MKARDPPLRPGANMGVWGEIGSQGSWGNPTDADTIENIMRYRTRGSQCLQRAKWLRNESKTNAQHVCHQMYNARYTRAHTT
eukprot:924792-Pyramimonas_sp.AAC.1